MRLDDIPFHRTVETFVPYQSVISLTITARL